MYRVRGSCAGGELSLIGCDSEAAKLRNSAGGSGGGGVGEDGDGRGGIGTTKDTWCVALSAATIYPRYRTINMSVAKSAATKIDWSKIIPQLGLTGHTATSLTAFKKRNDEAKSALYELKQQPTDVNFGAYSKLKNAEIVSKIKADVASFNASTIDLQKQLNIIQGFEVKAIENAKKTEELVLAELADLEKTLDNIESARPFDQLTVDDVVKARPDVEDKVQDMVSKGRFEVPGYKEKFGDLVIM